MAKEHIPYVVQFQRFLTQTCGNNFHLQKIYHQPWGEPLSLPDNTQIYMGKFYTHAYEHFLWFMIVNDKPMSINHDVRERILPAGYSPQAKTQTVGFFAIDREGADLETAFKQLLKSIVKAETAVIRSRTQVDLWNAEEKDLY